MTDVVLLFGRPGVGKFTIGQLLAEELDFRLLHNHAVVDLVESLFPFGSKPFVRLREEMWLAAVDAALAAALPGVILTFVPEATVTDDFLPRVRTSVENHGGLLRLIELRCVPEEIERRLSQPSREKFGKLRDVAQYRALEAAGVFLRPAMPPPEFVADVTDADPRESARRIADHLRSRHYPA